MSERDFEEQETPVPLSEGAISRETREYLRLAEEHHLQGAESRESDPNGVMRFLDVPEGYSDEGE